VGIGHGVDADVAVGRVQAFAIQRLEVHAHLARHLLAEQEVIEAERVLHHHFTGGHARDQAAVAGDAVVLRTVDVQLLQERGQARYRAAAGQHDPHALRPCAGNGLLHARGELVRGVQQRAIHIDGHQFNGRLAASHVHLDQPRSLPETLRCSRSVV